MRNYVTKQVIASECRPRKAEDWRKISEIIQGKYNKVNPEY